MGKEWAKFDLFEFISLICKFGMKISYYKVIIESQWGSTCDTDSVTD